MIRGQDSWIVPRVSRSMARLGDTPPLIARHFKAQIFIFASLNSAVKVQGESCLQRHEKDGCQERWLADPPLIADQTAEAYGMT